MYAIAAMALHPTLAGNDKLRIERKIAEAREREPAVRDVLRSLGAPRAPAVTEPLVRAV